MKKLIFTLFAITLGLFVSAQNDKTTPSSDRYIPDKMLHASIVTKSEMRTFYRVGEMVYSTKPSAGVSCSEVKIKVSVMYEVMTAVKAKGSFCDKSRLGEREISCSPSYPAWTPQNNL